MRLMKISGKFYFLKTETQSYFQKTIDFTDTAHAYREKLKNMINIIKLYFQNQKFVKIQAYSVKFLKNWHITLISIRILLIIQVTLNKCVNLCNPFFVSVGLNSHSLLPLSEV